MAEPFGDHNPADETGKRPAPIIEGTAEEVTPEAGAEAGAQPAAVDHPAFAAPEPDASATPPEETPADNATASDAGGMETKVRPPAAEPPPNTDQAALTSFFTHLAAGCVGALIGVIGLAFAWNLFPALLVSGDSQSLAPRVAALEAKQAESGKPPVALSELQARVGRLEDALKAMAVQAKNGGSVADAAAVSQQIAAAETRLQNEISQHLSATKGADAAGLQHLQQEVDALKAQLATLVQTAQASGGQAEKDAIAAVEQRVGKLEKQVPDLSGRLAKNAAEARAAAASAALSGLRNAVESGRPYVAELAKFTAVGPSGGDLTPLSAEAKDGIPTIAELTQGFQSARQKAVAATAPPPDDSLLGTLMSSASSVVKVRRLDAKGETGADVGLDHAKRALDHSDVAAAVKEVEALNGSTKSVMAGWLTLAHRRLAAEEVLQQLAAQTPPPGEGPDNSGL